MIGTKEWSAAFRRACRRHGMRFVSDEGFLVDDVYISSIGLYLRTAKAGWNPEEVGWTIEIKPLALDEVLWAAFMPEVSMGPRMRVNRRINGAFQIRARTIDTGNRSVSKADQPDQVCDEIVEHYLAVRSEFITRHPTVADFLTVVHAPGDDPARPIHLQREITTLIAAGNGQRAAELAEAALARGEHGTMSNSRANVLELLAAYAKGPDAYAAFMKSLTPTHRLQWIREDRPSVWVELVRGRHRGNFAADLLQFDGTNTWAIVLEQCPPDGAEHDQAAVRYLQAAGTAEAMTVEVRQPGGQQWGAVSVRSALGHPAPPGAARDVAIVLPRSTETVCQSEVFTAEEAACLFDTYYQTGVVSDDYTLRPIEGYAGDGGYVQPPSQGGQLT
ncbi:hypothetical protein [Mycobacterium branderi]|uniref:Uncharacterized protein n=1 Tax=Mycobacterium branderi TaxID=43348 RepID=A0A7I7WF13_9MYCO|nr:hypothetical protein [Mycobacterium branderi]MCV7236224.1 hypothetical protein [Mycobacterium branderi]ORA35411.1 hypothetical protein BST20_17575 [Mycobacterium branderi]BBZ15103.1 hypothetical protein MBRA_52980 [Mycobacterium branderi]